MDADILYFYAHKVTYEKTTKSHLDVQTSCLRDINMVFIINKHGVYEVSCFLILSFLLSKKNENCPKKKHLTVLKVLVNCFYRNT